jgi:hypothetical protein
VSRPDRERRDPGERVTLAGPEAEAVLRAPLQVRPGDSDDQSSAENVGPSDNDAQCGPMGTLKEPLEEGSPMTAVLPERSNVVDASDEDLRLAMKRALLHAGVTYEELERQARTGDFQSVRAQMAWVAIGGLRAVLPE